MHRPDVRVDADVGAPVGGHLRDLARVVHPHLGDDDLRLVGRVAQAEREADLVVEVPPRLERAPLGGDESVDHLLGRGLARRPGDRDQKERELAAHGGRERLERRGGVRDLDDPLPRGQWIGKGGHDRAAPLLEGLREKCVAVEAIAADREEDGGLVDLAAVDRDAARGDLASLDEPPADHRGKARERQRGHEASFAGSRFAPSLSLGSSARKDRARRGRGRGRNALTIPMIARDGERG